MDEIDFQEELSIQRRQIQSLESEESRAFARQLIADFGSHIVTSIKSRGAPPLPTRTTGGANVLDGISNAPISSSAHFLNCPHCGGKLKVSTI